LRLLISADKAEDLSNAMHMAQHLLETTRAAFACWLDEGDVGSSRTPTAGSPATSSARQRAVQGGHSERHREAAREAHPRGPGHCAWQSCWSSSRRR
jgi:hypothetical protein